MYCPHCNKEVNAPNGICPECGTQIGTSWQKPIDSDQPAQQTQQVQQPQQQAQQTQQQYGDTNPEENFSKSTEADARQITATK